MEESSQSGKPTKPTRFRHERVIDWFLKNKIVSIVGVLFLLLLYEVFSLPFGEIEKFRNTNPTLTAFMQEHSAVALRKGKRLPIEQHWVPLHSISPHLVNAVIVAEDGTFLWHDGFDWFEFRESFARNVREGRAVRGASTITQQLVKNLFLSPSKNPLRKVREWILTWHMERTLGKRRILELYLNVIEWGNGVYGIEAASRRYFGKSSIELNREESALLAAVIPNPKKRRPDVPSSYIERRAALILSRMTVRGM